MASILVIDNQDYRRESLLCFLSEAGYEASGINDSHRCEDIDGRKYDLVLLNLFPNAVQTWDYYGRLKKKFRELPVVVYVRDNLDALNSIMQVIELITPECRLVENCEAA